MIDYSATVTMFCQANDLPQPVSEYRFAPPRRWRFDFCFVEQRIALEVEGGTWGTSRHTTGAGYQGDMCKYNQAALLGYTVLRYTPQQLRAGDWVADVKAALAARERER